MLLRKKTIVLIVLLIKEFSKVKIRRLLSQRSHQKGSQQRVNVFSSIFSHSFHKYLLSLYLCQVLLKIWGYKSGEKSLCFHRAHIPVLLRGWINSEVSEKPQESETVQDSHSRYFPGLSKHTAFKVKLKYFFTLKSKYSKEYFFLF